MRRRKNKTEEHVDSHRWLVSYADFITLLFAFFVVMYAVSSVNQAKYKSLSEGMNSAFNKKDQAKAVVSTDKVSNGNANRQTKGTFRDGLDDLNKSLSELEQGDFKINRQEGWIEINMKAGSLFETGNASIKPDAMIKLMAVAQKIKEQPFPITVEGYTDNSPIETPTFPSNWELSAARAATIGRILNSFGISPSRILITGYGEQFPLDDNLTEAGRSNNRRVNILITKDRMTNRMLNPAFGQMHQMTVDNPKPIPKKAAQPKKKKDKP